MAETETMSCRAALTEEQARAARTIDRHVSVTAGPGGGKTTVLVERYLEILRRFKDVSVDQIVAITFTNRAANEMRTRLRFELDRLMKSAEGAERARWLRHKRTLDGAIITTIHGFCSRLLRQFPIEARVDPQFELLDEHQTAMLEEAIAEEVLTEFINKGDAAIANLTVAKTRPVLASSILEMYRGARNQGISLDDLAVCSDQAHLRRELLDEKLGELDQQMEEFIQTPHLPRAAEEKRCEAARRWPALRALLHRAATSDADESVIGELRDELKVFREQCRPVRSNRTARIVDALDPLIWSKDARLLVPYLIFDLHARKYVAKLVLLLTRLEIRLAEEKQRLGALDFDDLQIKALELLNQPRVRRRAASGYRFYLVDEFQDTNGLQRDLLEKFTLSVERGARHPNLFIVGDRKQSIYGFRGADVDVFREMTEKIKDADGLSVALDVNFRSRRPLVRFFNHLFERAFEPDEPVSTDELNELGFVAHEPGEAERNEADEAPLVELLLDLRPDEQDKHRIDRASERDAKQVTRRIQSLLDTFSYRDIALLFRAMTDVNLYESEFRRAGIPYLTVQGKGFYAREEVTDLIELLQFLDNRTDEIALATVLRSPICGLSDNALYALRCGPTIDDVRDRGRLRRVRGVRPLLYALRHHRRIDLIDDREREMIERARGLLDELLAMRNRMSLTDLLRGCIEGTEYRSVIAANFDGAARLANVEKLLVLAERFERSGANLVRDFVKFVADFEKTGGRESEGQIDESADAVRLMTIHQSKGLEFPVVIIPELHRQADVDREWFALDRQRGLTVQVPDGLGGTVKGGRFIEFRHRAKLREQFESMRLLFVAATRARDRLILSGAAKDLTSSRRDTWLCRICGALEITGDHEKQGERILEIGGDVEIVVSVNSLDIAEPIYRTAWRSAGDDSRWRTEKIHSVPVRVEDLPTQVDDWFPLLRPLAPDRGSALHRFSVTQLANYQRCPRQYYFDRVLFTPTGDEIDWWNSADSPEPPSNLTATLRGAVIHHFCDKYEDGDDPLASLTRAFDEVLRYREADLGDRVAEIDRDRAIADLMPLAQNYLSSDVRRRIEAARSFAGQQKEERAGDSRLEDLRDKGSERLVPPGRPGVFSEQRFRLRRPLGILTGTIDKLIAVPAVRGGLDVEIVDFKTNRFRRQTSAKSPGVEPQTAKQSPDRRGPSSRQLSFGFLGESNEQDQSLQDQVELAAADYSLQMQAYALAARDLIPAVANVRVTLHFLDPNIEFRLSDELLEYSLCAEAVDKAATEIVSSTEPSSFPANPTEHCRVCSFKKLCRAGRRWLENCN